MKSPTWDEYQNEESYAEALDSYDHYLEQQVNQLQEERVKLREQKETLAIEPKPADLTLYGVKSVD